MAKRAAKSATDEMERSFGTPFVAGMVFVLVMVGLTTIVTRWSMNGKETGRCYGNNTCNVGLGCLSGVCVKSDR